MVGEKLEKKDLPTIKALKEFLKEHARILNSSNVNVKGINPPRILFIQIEIVRKKSISVLYAIYI